MANLVNPVSLRLSYNCYWNNTWAIGKQVNYSYICMVDFYLFKYLSFLWDKLRWYRKGLLFIGFKFFRIFNKVWLNFIYRNHNLSFFIKEALVLNTFKHKRKGLRQYKVSIRSNKKGRNMRRHKRFVSRYVVSINTLSQRGLWGSKRRVRCFLRKSKMYMNRNGGSKYISFMNKRLKRLQLTLSNIKFCIF